VGGGGLGGGGGGWASVDLGRVPGLWVVNPSGEIGCRGRSVAGCTQWGKRWSGAWGDNAESGKGGVRRPSLRGGT